MTMTKEQSQKINEIKESNYLNHSNVQWDLWIPRGTKAMLTATYSQSNGIRRVARFQINANGNAWKLRPNGKIAKTL